MATIKSANFPADAKAKGASVEVIHDHGTDGQGRPLVTSWSMTPEQAVKHAAQFRPDMGGADQAKLDALGGS